MKFRLHTLFKVNIKISFFQYKETDRWFFKQQKWIEYNEYGEKQVEKVVSQKFWSIIVCKGKKNDKRKISQKL